MTNQDRLLSDLRNLKYDRLAVLLMHDDIVRLNDDIVGQRHRDVDFVLRSIEKLLHLHYSPGAGEEENPLSGSYRPGPFH